MKVVLTIAGSDPTSAAGIQADLQVIRDFGHHGASVLTAVIAQNTQGVRRCDPVDRELLGAQLDAVLSDLDVAAVKVGLVPTAPLVDLVVAVLAEHNLPVVWDPVVASGDARTSLYVGAPRALRDAARRVTLFTPNLPELQWLTGAPAASLADAIDAARSLDASVLLKVGHLPRAERATPENATLRDVLVHDGAATHLTALPAVDFDARGTGCHLSTAIACALAEGDALHHAVERGRRYLNERLTGAAQLGRGRRVITHR